jgi:hypothetical protein
VHDSSTKPLASLPIDEQRIHAAERRKKHDLRTLQHVPPAMHQRHRDAAKAEKRSSEERHADSDENALQRGFIVSDRNGERA